MSEKETKALVEVLYWARKAAISSIKVPHELSKAIRAYDKIIADICPTCLDSSSRKMDKHKPQTNFDCCPTCGKN